MRRVRAILCGALTIATSGLAVSACGSDSGPCAEFSSPKRSLAIACERANPNDAMAMAACSKGSGYAGVWAVDQHGLPAFDLAIEQRCDAIAEVRTEHGSYQSDPAHLLGNGHGMVAMAHASGAIEILRQDRGRAWLNKADAYRDPEDTAFPMQLGGGHSYVVVGGAVESTRYSDFSVAKASKKQSRRFGVGYFETVTTLDDVRVTRRVFPADSGVRALVAEVTLENLSAGDKAVGLVEFWDLNQQPILAEPDLRGEQAGVARLRRRREAAAGFTQDLRFSSDDGVATSQLVAKSIPDAVLDESSPAEMDYFPPEVFLAVVDEASAPDAVWLSDNELWGAGEVERPIPRTVAEPGTAESRVVALDGEGQGGILAMRVPVFLPVGASVTRRFAIGYASDAMSTEDSVTALRSANGELLAEAALGWKDRLAWMAVDAEDSGVVQRELAWSSYYVQAQAFYDDFTKLRTVGVGGVRQFEAGLVGNAGDLALNAEGLLHINSDLARETLLYALSSQHPEQSETPFRFAGSLTGVQKSVDEHEHSDRSDGYALVPGAVGRYLGLTRERSFSSAKAPYWPVSEGIVGEVHEHLAGAVDYAHKQLGFGATGLLKAGSSDFGGAPVQLALGTEFLLGSESALNAAMVVAGFPLLASMLESADEVSVEPYLALLNGQADALETAWNGMHYERAFSSEGNAPSAAGAFASVQALVVLAGATDDERFEALVATMTAEQTEVHTAGPVRAAIGAWETAAISLVDPAQAWNSLLANSLAAHADSSPEAGYSVWTGAGTVTGPLQDEPGAAFTGGFTPGAEFPFATTETHMAMVRAATSLLGITPSAAGWEIRPRLPSETFSVRLPELELYGTDATIGGSVTARADELLVLDVQLPSGLRGADLIVRVKEAEVVFELVGDDTVRFPLPVRRGQSVPFLVRAQ